MDVMVMGAGALGSLVGGLLARSGVDVTLVGRTAHVAAINENGLKIEGLIEETITVKASTTPMDADLIIFAVKSYDTETAARSLPNGDAMVLTLQNGMGNVETIASIIGGNRVLAGTTSMGSTYLGPGKIRYNGRGQTRIGQPSGGIDDRVEDIVKIFGAAGIPVEASQDIKADLWAKLAVNAGINAPAYLTGLPNGDLLAHEGLVWLMHQIGEEVALVARAEGVELERPVERIMDVARDTAQNRCSMLQDRDRERRTEIDAINGAVVQYGEKHDIPTPMNKVMVSLVKGMEAMLVG